MVNWTQTLVGWGALREQGERASELMALPRGEEAGVFIQLLSSLIG